MSSIPTLFLVTLRAWSLLQAAAEASLASQEFSSLCSRTAIWCGTNPNLHYSGGRAIQERTFKESCRERPALLHSGASSGHPIDPCFCTLPLSAHIPFRSTAGTTAMMRDCWALSDPHHYHWTCNEERNKNPSDTMHELHTGQINSYCTFLSVLSSTIPVNLSSKLLRIAFHLMPCSLDYIYLPVAFKQKLLQEIANGQFSLASFLTNRQWHSSITEPQNIIWISF